MIYYNLHVRNIGTKTTRVTIKKMIECLLRASPLNKVSSGENTNATEMHIKTYLNRYCRNGAGNAGVPPPELSLLPYCSFSFFLNLFNFSS